MVKCSYYCNAMFSTLHTSPFCSKHDVGLSCDAFIPILVLLLSDCLCFAAIDFIHTSTYALRAFISADV